jgi:hypothetical protein
MSNTTDYEDCNINLYICKFKINKINFKNGSLNLFNINTYDLNVERYYDSLLFISEYSKKIKNYSILDKCKILLQKNTNHFTIKGILFICNFYERNEDYQNMVWFYEMLYNYYNYYSVTNIYFLIFYYLKINIKNKLQKYYSILIANNKINNLLLYGSINEILNDDDKVEEIYKIVNTEYSYYKLANYYYNTNKIKKLKDILIECIELKYYDKLLFKLIDKFKFKYKLIIINKLNLADNLPNDLKIKISEIEQDKEIQIYKNKVRLFTELNNIKECRVCLQTKLNIILDCGHEICTDCFPKLKECYYKC